MTRRSPPAHAPYIRRQMRSTVPSSSLSQNRSAHNPIPSNKKGSQQSEKKEASHTARRIPELCLDTAEQLKQAVETAL